MSTVRVLLLAVALAVVPAGVAQAVPAVDGVFDLPGVQTNGQLVVGPDGNIWVSLEAAVGRVKPDGTVTVFASTDLNNALGSPAGGIASAGGFIWVSQGTSGGKKAIVKIPPGDPASAVGVDVTGITGGATAVTTGPDGNVWVGLADKIVRFSPADPTTTTTFNLAGLSPRAIIAASDGTLWVTDTANGGRLVNLSTGGAVIGTPVTVGGNPQFAAAGPSAQIAFSNPNATPQQIGLFSPGGSPQTFDRPAGSDPFGVTFGADGAYWVAEFAGNRLARVTTDGQLTTLGGFPPAPAFTQGPRQIVAGPNNTLWATIDKPGDSANTKIARITGVDPPPVTSPGPGPDQTPTGGGTAQPPPPDKTPPAIGSVSLTKGRTTVTLRFTLSEAASLRLTLSRAAAGKRRGKACVKPTTKLRRARRCTRFVRVTSVSRSGAVGRGAIKLNTRRLPKGRYRLVLTAVDAAGNAAVPVSRSFTRR